MTIDEYYMLLNDNSDLMYLSKTVADRQNRIDISQLVDSISDRIEIILGSTRGANLLGNSVYDAFIMLDNRLSSLVISLKEICDTTLSKVLSLGIVDGADNVSYMVDNNTMNMLHSILSEIDLCLKSGLSDKMIAASGISLMPTNPNLEN